MTLQDVARIAGVSRSTVSRVVNNDPRVSDTVRARVQQTIEDIGYKPNAAARALASQRSRVLGLVVPEDFARMHADTWYSQIIEACLAETRSHNLGLLLIMENNSHEAGLRIIEEFHRAGRVDGFMLVHHRPQDALVDTLVDAAIPFVLIGESFNHAWPSFDGDNFAGGQMAACHMLRYGVTRPAILTCAYDHAPSEQRRQGFRAACADAGIDIAPDHDLITGYLVQGSMDIIRGLLCADDRPDAIFAVNGWIARLVVQVADQFGQTIPGSFRLMEFDDFTPELNDAIGLTALVQPVRELAAAAVIHLIGRIDSPEHLPSTSIAHPALVVRGSCGEPIPIGHTEYARAAKGGVGLVAS